MTIVCSSFFHFRFFSFITRRKTAVELDSFQQCPIWTKRVSRRYFHSTDLLANDKLPPLTAIFFTPAVDQSNTGILTADSDADIWANTPLSSVLLAWLAAIALRAVIHHLLIIYARLYFSPHIQSYTTYFTEANVWKRKRRMFEKIELNNGQFI